MIERKKFSFNNFGWFVFGKTNSRDMVQVFNTELVHKFTREVCDRLKKIMEDIGDATEVRSAALIVFNQYDYSGQDHTMNFHGNVQGNIAGPGANITGSTATYNDNADLVAALKALKPLIGEVAAEQRQAVSAALDAMVEATTKNVPVAQIADVQPAVAQVAAASPTLKDRLAGIGGNLGLSLTGSAIFQAIKMVCGIS